MDVTQSSNLKAQDHLEAPTMAAVADDNFYNPNNPYWARREEEDRQRLEEEAWEIDRTFADQIELAQEVWEEYLRNGPDQPEEETDWDATSDDDMEVDIIASNK